METSKPVLPTARPLNTPKRMDQYNIRGFHRSQPPSSHIASYVLYFVDVILRFSLKVSFFFFELLIVIFLMPGIGDRWMGGDQKFTSEYAIPFGHTRYVFVAFLLLLLLIRIGSDFWWKGVRLVQKNFLIDIMSSSHARLLSSLGHYKYWRFYGTIYKCLTPKERLISWVLMSTDEWKRLLVVRIPFILLLAITLRNATANSYKSPIPLVKTVAITYMILRMTLCAMDVLNKIAAALFYHFRLKPMLKEKLQNKVMPGGYTHDGTLTGYWHVVVQRHADAIIANSYWSEEQRQVLRRKSSVQVRVVQPQRSYTTTNKK